MPRRASSSSRPPWPSAMRPSNCSGISSPASRRSRRPGPPSGNSSTNGSRSWRSASTTNPNPGPRPTSRSKRPRRSETSSTPSAAPGKASADASSTKSPNCGPTSTKSRRGAPGDGAAAALRQENLASRNNAAGSPHLEEEAAETATLRGQVHGLRDQFHRVQQELASSQDEVERQRIEHEAEKAALRTKLTSERVAGGAENGALSTDERVRALRDHLREMHERDERKQKESQLSHRIAKLWRRSTPR